jgi:hypothetical protein
MKKMKVNHKKMQLILYGSFYIFQKIRNKKSKIVIPFLKYLSLKQNKNNNQFYEKEISFKKR